MTFFCIFLSKTKYRKINFLSIFFLNTFQKPNIVFLESLRENIKELKIGRNVEGKKKGKKIKKKKDLKSNELFSFLLQTRFIYLIILYKDQIILKHISFLLILIILDFFFFFVFFMVKSNMQNYISYFFFSKYFLEIKYNLKYQTCFYPSSM